MPLPFDGFSIFDDKREVKRLVDSLIQDADPEVSIESLRKIDYSYIFTLFKKGRTQEVQLNRPEIDASWAWRHGNIDDTLERKIRDTIDKL